MRQTVKTVATQVVFGGQITRDSVLRCPCWHGVMKGRVKHSDHWYSGTQHSLRSLDSGQRWLVMQRCQLAELGKGCDNIVIQACGCHKVGSAMDNAMPDGV